MGFNRASSKLICISIQLQITYLYILKYIFIKDNLHLDIKLTHTVIYIE